MSDVCLFIQVFLSYLPYMEVIQYRTRDDLNKLKVDKIT